MKKTFILAIALMATMMANAQVSVQLGYLLNTEKTKTALGNDSYSYSGLMAAADYNLNIAGNLFVAPGLGVGYSFDNSDGSRYRELGLFVPVDVNYCFPIGNDISLSVFAGPTFCYGLIAKDTAFDYYENNSKRFELLLGGGLWCDIKETIRVKAGYKWGLTNTSKINGITEKNNGLYLSIGYLF